VELAITAIARPDERPMFAGYLRDLSEAERAAALSAGQNRVLQMMATGAPFTETLDTLLRVIEADSPDMLGSILLIDADGKHLHHAAARSLPSDYCRAIDGEAIGPSAGSCGTAAWRREQVVVGDIRTSPLWADYRERADTHGLRACWSTPIFDAQRRVLGTFALYFREPALPTERHAHLIEMATQTAAIAIVNQRTERERAELLQALRRRESIFRSIFENAAIGVTLLDMERCFIRCNPAFTRLLGYSEEELIGAPFARLTHPDDIAPNEELYRSLEDGERDHFSMDKRYLRKDGSVVWVRITVSLVPAEEGTNRFTIGMLEDITARKQAEARIEYLATHDDLTDLPNRNLLHDRITQAIAHARRAGTRIALLSLDLDGFKVVNDGFGHPFGDALLKLVAARLRSLVREADTVTRQGGDEFLMLLTDLREPEAAFVVADKVRRALEQSFAPEGREVFVSASIGACVYPEDGEDAQTLIANADVAMYRAKDAGRNTWQFFTRQMSDEIQERVRLETALRVAVARSELSLVYQPKVELASGRITGCEALLRWTHPEMGAVSPARFIPVAEASGQIVPIGDWALRAACAQCQAWSDAGLPALPVAVNISTRQFLRQDVVAWVLAVLEETRLAPDRLELELTESLIAEDTEKVIATINQLKNGGVRFGIDDFGTGYSSLNYLKRFRVDTLKVDQSFVRHMLTEPGDAAIVLAVISLGHSLGMTVLAEGVETAEQCAALRRTGCDEMQGYYFSKPLPARDFAHMLASGKRLSGESSVRR
jgi:diguanylate cyclase (GGDEF)-like protein/PAS domain S-box-containing protein